MRQLRRFIQRYPHVGRHLDEQQFRRGRITVHQPGQVSQIDGDCDEVLLHAIMDGAFDRAPIGVRGFGQSPPRPTKLRYFTLQSVDTLIQPFARASVRHRPTSLDVAGH